jgi:endonuclease-8
VPEGDTISRTATTLRRWLEGRVITSARSTAPRVDPAVLTGDRVVEVTARGKHLLIGLASGRVLHTHMRMTGSWHVYTTGERWQRPAWRARLVLESDDRQAVCFDAPVIELLAPGGTALHPGLAALGPDILAEPLDVSGIVRRMAARPVASEIGDLLLDQSVVAGIGNIYRCEALFLTGVHPRRKLRDLSEDVLAGMIVTAGRLMAANLGARGDDRSLGPSRRRWVYRRAGRPCRRCASPIAHGRVGAAGRTAYWCPRCQL